MEFRIRNTKKNLFHPKIGNMENLQNHFVQSVLANCVTTTTTTTICGDACPLSCASAEAYKLAQMHETAVMGKLINAAPFSLLMRRV